MRLCTRFRACCLRHAVILRWGAKDKGSSVCLSVERGTRVWRVLHCCSICPSFAWMRQPRHSTRFQLEGQIVNNNFIIQNHVDKYDAYHRPYQRGAWNVHLAGGSRRLPPFCDDWWGFPHNNITPRSYRQQPCFHAMLTWLNALFR